MCLAGVSLLQSTAAAASAAAAWCGVMLQCGPHGVAAVWCGAVWVGAAAAAAAVASAAVHVHVYILWCLRAACPGNFVCVYVHACRSHFAAPATPFPSENSGLLCVCWRPCLSRVFNRHIRIHTPLAPCCLASVLLPFSLPPVKGSKIFGVGVANMLPKWFACMAATVHMFGFCWTGWGQHSVEPFTPCEQSFVRTAGGRSAWARGPKKPCCHTRACLCL